MISGFFVPTTATEAVRLRKELGEGACFLGGGTELNSLHAPPGRTEHMISLAGLDLGSIEVNSTEISIGAGCTLQELVEAEELPNVIRLACLNVENRTIRNQATIGGHIAVGHRYASVLPILVALGATVDVMTSDGGTSRDPMREHIGGASRALITEVRFPVLSSGLHTAVDQYCRSAIDLPIVTVAVVCRFDSDWVSDPRIVVGGLTDAPQRLLELEGRLDGSVLPPRESIEALVAEQVEVDEDPRASVEYRRSVAGTLVERALRGGVS